MSVTTALLLAFAGLQPADNAAPGQLTAITKDGTPGILVPLENTKVFADVGGIGARVTVIQTFKNTSQTPIEAVYTFPLPDDGAVDRMRMKIGDRIVDGEIKKREEARAIYNAARAAGQTASLLEQQRANIFTQNVANIMPGGEVQVEISYVHQLKYKDGYFEFDFPMVVGPRFLPASTPDPDKVNPQYLPPEARSGTHISLQMTVDPGAPADGFESVLHGVNITRGDDNRFAVTLRKSDSIPNKDFVFRYRVRGSDLRQTFLTNWDDQLGGVFCLNFVPPKADEAKPQPKEIVFVMDQSGSQSGFPIEKSKELTSAIIDQLNPEDYFNVVSFSNGARALWPQPVPNTAQNRDEAQTFVKGLQANGGTYFIPAVDLAYKMPRSNPEALKMVVFNTDGYVGNEFEILDKVQKLSAGTRMFTFGIGSSVNRFLIDAMAVEGRGDAAVVTLPERADPAVKSFVEKTASPVLTDLSVTVTGADGESITPAQVPDVFAGRPITIMGRYNRPGPATITVTGKLGGQPYINSFQVNLTNQSSNNKALQSLWARRRVDDLTRTRWIKLAKPTTDGKAPEDDNSDIVNLCLRYGIMSQWTSFVAVEKRVVNIGGKQRLVNVPVDAVDGLAPEAYPDGFARGSRSRGGAAMYANPAPGVGAGGFGGAGGSLGVSNGASIASASKTKSPAEDKSDNSIVFKDAKTAYLAKISPKLQKAKGNLELQIRVDKITDDLLKQLKKLGFKLADQDKNNKILFGTADAKILDKIAKLKEVLAIDPLTK